jgi:hypothetical protein
VPGDLLTSGSVTITPFVKPLSLLGLAFATAAAVLAGTAAGSPDRRDDCNAAARGSGGQVVCVGTIPASRRRVVLKSQNGSPVHGVAWVTLGLHETKVVITLTGQPAGARQPAFLQSGRCTGAGGAVFPLGTVLGGRRTARIAPMHRLSGYTIAVRESAGPGATVVACGVIPRHH